MTPRTDRRIVICLLLLAAVGANAPTLRGGFVWDDHTIVEKNPATDPATPLAEALSSPYWPPPRPAGLYRPVTTLVLRGERALFGLRPAGFRAVNLAAHALATLALAWLLAAVWPGKHKLTSAATLLFAVHPIHSEAVAGVVGLSEILAAGFGFLAYGLWRRCSTNPSPGLLGAVWSAWILALGSKESAAGWILLAAAHRTGLLPRLRPSDRIWRIRLLDAGAILLFAGFFLVRRQILGGPFGIDEPPFVDNPLAGMPWASRAAAAGGLWMTGMGRLLLPLRLVPDASYAHTLPVASAADVVATAGLAVLIGIVLARGRRGEPWIWGIAMGLATQSPTMNILFPIGTCYAERLFYAPSAGYLLAAAGLAGSLGSRLRLPRRAAAATLALAVAALGTRSIVAIEAWRSDETLFRRAVAVAPMSVKSHTNLAVQLWHKDDLVATEASVLRALEIKSDYAPAMILLSRVRHAQGDSAEARRILTRALADDDRYADGWMLLGAMALERSDGDGALAAYGNAHRIAPSDPEPVIGMASALAARGEWEEAIAKWQEARRLDPARLDLLYPYGSALQMSGRPAEALEVWREALGRGLRTAEILNDTAWLLLQRDERLEEAEKLSREALALREDGNHTDTLLRILVARRKFVEADSLLRRIEEDGRAAAWPLEEWKDVVTRARSNAADGGVGQGEDR